MLIKSNFGKKYKFKKKKVDIVEDDVFEEAEALLDVLDYHVCYKTGKKMTESQGTRFRSIFWLLQGVLVPAVDGG